MGRSDGQSQVASLSAIGPRGVGVGLLLLVVSLARRFRNRPDGLLAIGTALTLIAQWIEQRIPHP